MSKLDTIRVGQIWIEVDPRFARHVRIETVDAAGGPTIGIQTVVRDGWGQWALAPRSRRTWADRSRFNGKRGNYALHEDI